MKRASQLLLIGAALLVVLGSSSAGQRPKNASHTKAAVAPTTPDKCPAKGTPFETPITQMPFPSPAPRQIDAMCPRGGTDDKNDNHRAQNAAKNYFTAKGTPVLLTFADFTDLQRATDGMISSGRIKLDSKGYPNDRENSLRNQLTVQGQQIGEGTLVTLEAYVYSAHYSNTKFNIYQGNKPGTGEANNCGCNRVDWNDIHIALSEAADHTANECGTVTAEISPHYRPVVWSRFHDGQIPEIEASLPGLLSHKVIENQSAGDLPLRVRITGPLFYDASHQPCLFNASGAITKHNSPARRTIWEIHPAYRIQVYDAAKQQWVELNEWAQ
jgi:hypothetical protein